MPGRLRTGCDFYPRPPRGGRPPYLTAICSGIMISIHALREEGDCSSWASTRNRENFYPRPPRGGRPFIHHLGKPSEVISIHALREEGDLSSTILESPRRSFLSTPSARRATAEQLDAEYQAAKFLSTPSARRATLCFVAQPPVPADFYPRPPRGGRPATRPAINWP